MARRLVARRQTIDRICRRRALEFAIGERRSQVFGDSENDGATILAEAEVYRAFLLGGDEDYDARTRALDLAYGDTAKARVALAKRFLAYVDGERRGR